MLIYSPNTNLSKSFKMFEVSKSSTADRYHIDNTPTPAVLEAALLLATNVLEPIRAHFGIPISPTSWYRGEKLERVINEVNYKKWCARMGLPVGIKSWKSYFAKKSHPRGEAIDFEIAGIPNDDIVEWIDTNIDTYDQLIREFPRDGDPFSGWVHVSFSATNNRREKFVIV